MEGDPTLFARQDGVEAAWAVVDHVLGDVTPLHEYPQGSWGPPEAERLTDGNRSWHNPAPSGP
jgi:glucose-6-phosphate 1-dehydrogenase